MWYGGEMFRIVKRVCEIERYMYLHYIECM